MGDGEGKIERLSPGVVSSSAVLYYAADD